MMGGFELHNSMAFLFTCRVYFLLGRKKAKNCDDMACMAWYTSGCLIAFSLEFFLSLPYSFGKGKERRERGKRNGSGTFFV